MLRNKGYDVLLIGRKEATSLPLEKRDYATFRMRLPFEKGPLFYATFNIGLFYHLLFTVKNLKGKVGLCAAIMS